MLIQMLLYKSVWQRKNIVKIGRFDPSSQICSNCGTRKHNLNLDDRVYHCGICDFKIDRDINAAINIKELGLNQFNLRQELSEVKPLEKQALTKGNKRKLKSISETSLVELGKKRSYSKIEVSEALASS